MFVLVPAQVLVLEAKVLVLVLGHQVLDNNTGLGCSSHAKNFRLTFDINI